MSDVTPESAGHPRPIETNRGEELPVVEHSGAEGATPVVHEPGARESNVHEPVAHEPEPLVEPEPLSRAEHPVQPAGTEYAENRRVEEVPAAASAREPIVATTEPGAVATAAPLGHVPPPVQTVYMQSPVAPSKRGNRGVGVLIALLSTVIFAVVYGVVLAIIRLTQVGEFRVDFLSSVQFYVPVLFFAAGFILLALIVNRANWWAYVLGSLFVGLFVYFGTIGTGLLMNGVMSQTPTAAAKLFGEALVNPFVIAAALVARETSMWMGSAISARGRRVRLRNIEDRAAFERESVDRETEYSGYREGAV